MAFVVKISRPGQASKTIPLKKGANKIVAEAGAKIEIVDDESGQAPADAVATRSGDELVVTAPSAEITVTIDDFYAMAGGEPATLELPGLSSGTFVSEAAAGGASSTAGGGSGGGTGPLLGVLGGLLAAGGLAAAAGGGGGGSDQPADTAAPAAPTDLALAAADDLGSSSSDRITSRTSALTISGKAEAGARVELFDGATSLGTVTADGSGNFSLDVTLTQGVHAITARATDAAGNASPASTALSVEVDTTAPTVQISATDTALILDETTSVTFTFSEAPTGFSADDVVVSGGAISGLTSSVDGLTWTATLTPTATVAGPITIQVAGAAFTDTAGNASTAASASVSYDPGTDGSAIDGYIANALVFRDVNNNNVWDHDAFDDANNNGLWDTGEALLSDANGDGLFTAEAHVVTKADGTFSNLTGSGRIVLAPLVAGDGTVLTRDISTGELFTKQLSAPDGATVVTPLTTIVDALAGTGADAEAIALAQQQVRTALGLSEGVDLQTFDPIAVAAQTSDAAVLENAIAVQKAAIQIANILTVVTSAAEAAGASGGSLQAAATAIAEQIAATGGEAPLDLAGGAVIGSIITAVAEAAGDADVQSALAAQAQAVATSLANVNQAVAEAGSAGGDAASVLAAVVAVQIVAQVDLVAAVTTSITGSTPLDSSAYGGSALGEKIDTAATQVEVVVPVAQPVEQQLGQPQRPVVDDGARVNAEEIEDGVSVSISYDATADVQVGDRIRILLGGAEVASRVLEAADIAGAGETRTLSFLLSAETLGADGARLVTANFVSAAGVSGPASLPAVFTLDTVVATPVIDPVSGGAINAAEAGAATGVTLSGIEAGSNARLILTGSSAANGATISVVVPGTGSIFSIPAAQLAQFADGTLTLAASQTDAAGNESATGTRTLTLDRAAPVLGAPSIGEGPVVTAAEAGDGTTISGTVSGATAVSITLSNGVTSIVRAATLSGGSYSLDLGAQDLSTLGTGTISLTVRATDAAGNATTSNGVSFDYSITPAIVADASITTADAPLATDDDEGFLDIATLPGGGSVTIWPTDTNGDGEADTLAIQRFDAGGAKDGAPILLTGMGFNLGGDENISDALEELSIAARADGSYAVSYAVETELTTFTNTLGVTASGASSAVTVVGRPLSFTFPDGVPDGVTFELVGLRDGLDDVRLTVAPVDNVIAVTQEMLDTLGSARITLNASGVLTPQSPSSPPTALVPSFTVVTDAVREWIFSEENPLSVQTVDSTANDAGLFVLNLPTGRAEAFDVSGIAPSPTGQTFGIAGHYLVGIYPSNPGQVFGAQGVVSFPGSDGVTYLLLPADAEGIVALPQAILDQIGGQDASIFLAGYTVPGSGYTGTVLVREPTELPEGVFVQTFAPDGAAMSDPVRVDGGTNAYTVGGATINSLANGGHAVVWTVDSDRDDYPDQIAVRRFDVNGVAQGDAVILTGVTDAVFDRVDNDDDGANGTVLALDDGGYALAYQRFLPSVGNSGTVTTNADGEVSLTITGRPTFIGLPQDLPYSTRFFLAGTDASGDPVRVEVYREDGQILLSDGLFANFAQDDRLSLQIEGATATSNVSFFYGALVERGYDPAASLVVESVTGVAVQPTLVAIGTSDGRAESFDLATVPNGASFLLFVAPAGGTGVLQSIPNFQPLVLNSQFALLSVVPDANGVIAVPPAILEALGGTDASISLLANVSPGTTINAEVSVRPSFPLDSGVFVQSFDANGAARGDAVRIDTAETRLLQDEDNFLELSPLAGGGFAVSWIAGDSSDEDDGNAVAVQRFGADGTPDGSPLAIADARIPFSNETIDEAAEFEALAFTALADGGYGLSYTQVVDRGFQAYNLPTGPQGTVTAAIVGRPEEIFVTGGVTAATRYYITAPNDAGVLSRVEVFAVDGRIALDPAQLSNPYNTALTVEGATAQSNVQLVTRAALERQYAEQAPIETAELSGTASASGLISMTAIGGRAVAFDIDTLTTTANTSYRLIVTLPNGPGSLPVSGIAGYLGIFPPAVHFGVTPDANGVVQVPPALLDMLGQQDARIGLVVFGAQANSAFAGTVTYEVPTIVTDGVFVQTFDAEGHIVGTSPPPFEMVLALEDESGVELDDGVTNRGSGLTIQGSAAAGAAITLLEGDVVVGTGTTGADGRFAIDLTLDEGSHVLTARATSPSGVQSPLSEAFTITVDTTAPGFGLPVIKTVQNVLHIGVDLDAAGAGATALLELNGQVVNPLFLAGDATVAVNVGSGGVKQLVGTVIDAAGNVAPDTNLIIGTIAGETVTGTSGGEILYGFDGNDLILGGDGDDALVGMIGSDRLEGGAGRDTLVGGPQGDFFVLDTAAGSSLALADLINDFTIGQDQMVLPGSLTFADLTITQGAGGASDPLTSTVIGTSGGDVLAILANTDATQITQLQFGA